MRHQPTVFEQIVQHIPWGRFDRLVGKHGGDDAERGFSSRKHFLALLGGTLGGHHGLRQNVAALAPNDGALRLLGGGAAARSTLADATRKRPAALFVEFLHELIALIPARAARRDLKQAVRLIDATHIDLGLRMRRWAGMYRDQAAVKPHVVYDPCAQRPVFFDLTPARINDITAAKQLLPIEPGATYVFDLGYYDFGWFAKLAAADCVFVTRLKCYTSLRDTAEREVTAGGVVLSDRLGFLPKRLAFSRRNPFSQTGREVVIRIKTGKVLHLFTNDLTSPAEVIADLYKERWQIELFFKWIKQNLKISRFVDTSENAVRTLIAVAFIGYLLIRLTQLQQQVERPAAIVLLVIRCHLFVRRPITHLIDPPPRAMPPPTPQLSLFPRK
ncbi:MAG: IS4 family transposase [Acetobacteraceae bacterium]